jgi:polyhydroxybutyrate depolymerase
MSDVYAAVASVSGVLGIAPAECSPRRPVPIVHVHGTADATVPFEGGGSFGGLGSLVGLDFRSVAETVGAFGNLYRCAAAPRVVGILGDTLCQAWSGCQGGAEIELCTVTEGGHQWPGGVPSPFGGRSSDFPATKTILDFFDAHRMPN